MNKIIIIEKFNVFILLFLIIFSKNCDVYIFDTHQMDYNLITGIKDKYKKILNFFRPRIFLKKLSYSDNKSITFKSNKFALEYLKKLSIDEDNYILNIIHEYTKSKKISLAYKKLSQPFISQKIRFFLFIGLIEQYNSNCNINIFSNYNPLDNDKVLKILEHQKRFRNFSLHKLFLISNYIQLFSNLLFFIPFWIIKRIMRNGIAINTSYKTYNVGQQLNNGLKNNSIRRIVNRNDDDLFENLNTDNTDFIYIFSYWNFSKEERSSNINIIKKKKIQYTDELRIKIPIKKLFKEYLPIYFNIFKYLIFYRKKNKFINYLDQFHGRIICSIIHHEVFCSNYRVKIFFSRDDFSFHHVVRTIIQNKYKLNNYGLSHSSFVKPEMLTTCTFVYFDKYYHFGAGYLKYYRDYWVSKNFLAVGQPYANNIFNSYNNVDIGKRFKKIFKQGTNVLVTLPNIQNLPFFDSNRINKKYSEFSKILDIDTNINLIFRVRNKDHIKLFKNIIMNNKNYINRIFFINNEFTTHELMSQCNFIIGDDTSSALLEALTFGRIQIIPYLVRYDDPKILIWNDFDKNLVCKNIKEVCTFISKIIKNKNYANYNISEEFKKLFANKENAFTWELVASDINKSLIN